MIALIGLFKLSARGNCSSIIPILDFCVLSDITDAIIMHITIMFQTIFYLS